MFEKRSSPPWASLALSAMLLVLIFVLMIGFASAEGGPHPAQAGAARAPDGDGVWTPLGGPSVEGGQVLGLAVHPTISGTVYAAVSGIGSYDSGPSVVYKSDDGAATWTAVYTSERQIYSLAVTDTLVYAGLFNPDGENPSILASYDSGLTWAPVFTTTSRGVWLDISLHVSDTNVAIIGGWTYHGPDDQLQSGVVYGTGDGGMTWTPLLTATVPGAESGINAVMMHPVTPTLLLASMHTWGGPADQDSHIYRSADAGVTWPISVTVAEAHVVSLVANTADPDMIYAGAGFGQFSDGRAAVFRSTDAGLSYAEVHDSGTHLAFEPPSTVYTVMDTGENYVSTSDGDPGTWQPIGHAGNNAYRLAIDLGPTPANQYAGLWEQGVGKGTYDGANWNWEHMNNGIGTLASLRDIDVDPQDSDKIFAAAECAHGWRSDDGGQTWTEPSGLAGCMAAFAINPDDPEIVYGGAFDCSRGAVLRSGDGGLNFEPVYTATYIISDCSGFSQQIHALAIAPSMTDTVYAAGSDEYPDASRAVIVRSLDDGVSWTEVFTLPGHSRFRVLAIEPTNADSVYAGGETCDHMGCQGVAYRSTDGGDSWSLMQVTTETIESIVVDYQKPDVLYMADRLYVVWKSTDGGDTWFQIRANQPPFYEPSGDQLVIDPHVPSHLYLAGWGYIAETVDGGLTWDDGSINNGTPQMRPTALTVDNETMTQTLYSGFTGAWAYSRPAPQPGEAMTMTMFTDPLTNPQYANGLNDVFFLAYPLDEYDNWVAPGTQVDVLYEWDWDGGGQWLATKYTDQGYVTGGFLGVSSPGTITFTASANVTATAFVTMEFLYNPPAGISVVADPDSIAADGATSIVTATVAGEHDGFASGGTVVSFETTLGTIDATSVVGWRGVATATLTSGSAGGTATITARVDGFSDTTEVEITGTKIYLPIVLRNH